MTLEVKLHLRKGDGHIGAVGTLVFSQFLVESLDVVQEHHLVYCDVVAVLGTAGISQILRNIFGKLF